MTTRFADVAHKAEATEPVVTVYRLLVYKGPVSWVVSTLNNPNGFVRNNAPKGTLAPGKSITEHFIEGGYDLIVSPPNGVIR